MDVVKEAMRVVGVRIEEEYADDRIRYRWMICCKELWREKPKG